MAPAHLAQCVTRVAPLPRQHAHALAGMELLVGLLGDGDELAAVELDGDLQSVLLGDLFLDGRAGHAADHGADDGAGRRAAPRPMLLPARPPRHAPATAPAGDLVPSIVTHGERFPPRPAARDISCRAWRALVGAAGLAGGAAGQQGVAGGDGKGKSDGSMRISFGRFPFNYQGCRRTRPRSARRSAPAPSCGSGRRGGRS
jgi:hypothetical protein